MLNMKTKQNIFRLISSIGILVFGITVIEATETPSIQWNEIAKSKIMDNNELAKLGAAFPTWKIKQVTWPSASEINTNKVTADPNLTVQCMEWLSKFIKKEQLPTGLDKQLVAMKKWGLIREESRQKRLCDVFIARFKKAPYVIHVQESPCNVVIAVVDEQLLNDPRIDHKDLVIKIATSVLSEALKPDPNSENLHVFEFVRDNQKISRILWLVESVVTLKNGQTLINDANACKIGTSQVEAETDGKFVKFDIPKVVKGSRATPDPYVERFSTEKK